MKYFISYVHYEHGKHFFGNAEWEGEPISSLEQVKKIEEEICQQFHEEKIYVKILYWKSFGK